MSHGELHMVHSRERVCRSPGYTIDKVMDLHIFYAQKEGDVLRLAQHLLGVQNVDPNDWDDWLVELQVAAWESMESWEEGRGRKWSTYAYQAMAYRIMHLRRSKIHAELRHSALMEKLKLIQGDLFL